MSDNQSQVGSELVGRIGSKKFKIRPAADKANLLYDGVKGMRMVRRQKAMPVVQ